MKNVAIIAFAAVLFASSSFASESVAQAPSATPAAEIGLVQSVLDFLFGASVPASDQRDVGAIGVVL